MSPAERQAELLGQAGKYIVGGGLGLFTLPPEVNLVVAGGHGGHVTDVAGPRVHRLPPGLRPGPARPRPPGDHRGRRTPSSPKGTTYYFLNEPVIRLAKRLVEAIPCAEQVHFTGSGTEATFFSLRVARAYTGRDKVLKFEGGWHGMHDYGLWGTVPPTPSRVPARASPTRSASRAQVGDKVLVAPFNDDRARGRDHRAPRRRAGRRDRRAAAARARPGARLPAGGARGDQPPRHRADLRRDRHRLPHRLGRRAGALRRRAGPRDLRQGDERRLPDGRHRRPARGHGRARRAQRARAAEMAWASGTLNGNPVSATAGLAALDVLVAARRRTTTCTTSAAACARDRRSRRAPRLPGAGTGRGRRLRRALHRPQAAAHLDRPHDRRHATSASRWAIECLRRGLLVNPNEKFYISIAHTDADVDRTLAIADEAFAALKR